MVNMSRRINTGRRALLAHAVVLMSFATFSVQAAWGDPVGNGSGPGFSAGFGKEEIEIPQTPTAPPSLLQVIPPDPFHCHRKIVYQGKTLDCDTNVRRDGENLRPIIKDVPSAVSELDQYQSNRRNLRYVGYVASAGFALALLGYFGSRGTNGFRNAGALTPAGIVTLSGLGIALGSFSYGFYLYKSNESHLTSAVNDFNQARPKTPIELEFKTGFSF